MFIVVQRTRICDANIRKNVFSRNCHVFSSVVMLARGNSDVDGSRFNCKNFFSISFFQFFFFLLTYFFSLSYNNCY